MDTSAVGADLSLVSDASTRHGERLPAWTREPWGISLPGTNGDHHSLGLPFNWAWPSTPDPQSAHARSEPAPAQVLDPLTGLHLEPRAGTINHPVKVPLHWVELGDSGDQGQRKLGIYASLGGSRQPRLFELDSGGAGFYAAFAKGDGAPWWGPRVRSNAIPFEQTYDSGMTYTGTAVRSTIELFANRSARSSRLKQHNVVVGQTERIEDQRHDRPTTLWPESGGAITPPVSKTFYGDFGLAPKRGQHKIDSLAAQLHYGPGVTAGFRVHATAKRPWVQFGLGPNDLTVRPSSFRLNRAAGRKPSRTGVPYYHPFVLKGTLEIASGEGQAPVRFSRRSTGILLDTGASTSIHSVAPSTIPPALTVNGEGQQLSPGAIVTARSPSLDPGRRGQEAIVLQLAVGRHDDPPGFSTAVAIKPSASFDLNAGIRPFLNNDVIVNLAEGQLTLLPRPLAPTP